MTKMHLTRRAAGAVVVEYDDEMRDTRVTREFFVRGRYVYEDLGNGRDRQVCDRLQTRGSTLMSDLDSLPAVIRREYRAMRRAEAADAARYATF